MNLEKVDLSTFRNDWYKPGNIVKRTVWFITGRIFINTYLPFPQPVKRFVLRVFGAYLGKRVVDQKDA